MTPEQIAALAGVLVALGGLITAIVQLRKALTEARAQTATSDLALTTYRDNAKAATLAADEQRKAAEAERAAKEAERIARRDDALVDGMGRLVTTLQGELDTRTRSDDASRVREHRCMESLSKTQGDLREAIARIDTLEAHDQKTEEALRACENRDVELRRQLAQLDRRTKSDQSMPAVKE